MADDAGRIEAVDLYEADFAAWAEAQAALLLARRPEGLDWDNLADEVGSLARWQYNRARSFLGRIIEHLLKLEFVRSERDYPHWRGEVLNFRRQLRQYLSKTVENQVRPELADLYREEIKGLRVRGLIQEPTVLAARSDSYTWDQLLDDDYYPEPRID